MGNINSVLLIDIFSVFSIIFIFSSTFLILAIVTLLGSKQSYVLAKGWWLLLPAILVMSLIRIYDFFIVAEIRSAGQFYYETLYLLFGFFLFISLLVQFLAIKQTIEGRKK